MSDQQIAVKTVAASLIQKQWLLWVDMDDTDSHDGLHIVKVSIATKIDPANILDKNTYQCLYDAVSLQMSNYLVNNEALSREFQNCYSGLTPIYKPRPIKPSSS